MPRMRMTVVIEDTDGEQTHHITADGRDIRAYEAEFSESLLTRVDYSQVCKIAFVHMRRKGLFVGDWDQFDGACLDVEEHTDPEVDPDVPTQPDPGEEPSSS